MAVTGQLYWDEPTAYRSGTHIYERFRCSKDFKWCVDMGLPFGNTRIRPDRCILQVEHADCLLSVKHVPSKLRRQFGSSFGCSTGLRDKTFLDNTWIKELFLHPSDGGNSFVSIGTRCRNPEAFAKTSNLMQAAKHKWGFYDYIVQLETRLDHLQKSEINSTE
jgi:hypothetical protein